jgi:hypothetical protein
MEYPDEGEGCYPYNCGSCGYEVPTRWLQLDARYRLLNIPPCPICGGKVGYYAWLDATRARRKGVAH